MDRICSFYGAFGAVRLQPAPSVLLGAGAPCGASPLPLPTTQTWYPNGWPGGGAGRHSAAPKVPSKIPGLEPR